MKFAIRHDILIVWIVLAVVGSLPGAARAAHHGHRHGHGAALDRPPTPTKRKAARVALRGKLSAVSQKMRTVRTQLKQAKRSEADIAMDLDSIRHQLARTRARLEAAKEHLAAAQQEQKKVAIALADAERRLQVREVRLAERMAANYRQGPVRYASVILGARSMGDLVTRATFIRSVVQYDARLIDEIKQDRAEVLRWKAQVDRKTAEVAAVKVELGARQDEEAQEVVRRRDVLQEARQRRAEFESELDALQEDSAEIASRLRSLEETPVGRVRKMIAFRGGFIRPCDAPITSGFGMRYHPILHYTRLHAGIDFGAAWGSPILAAASGVVVFSGVMHGYGNVVVIDHGGGVSTLYGHCSARLVGEGQTVSKGQEIARVGMTGLATGPHLHFEIRHNGTPVDPMGSL